jgi:hypothetical protein
MELQIPSMHSHDLTEVKESNLELLFYAYSLLMFGGSEAYQTIRTMLIQFIRFWHAENPKRYSPANNSLH